MIFFTKNKSYKNANEFAIVIPLFSLINSFSINKSITIIANNIIYLYILFLVIKKFINDPNIKDIVATIGIFFIIFTPLFMKDLLIGCYIGLLALFIMIIGFYNKQYKKLFYFGIIITILNIIIQLWNYWSRIPFWLYLLLSGLFLITFVTYKENTKKNNEKIESKLQTHNQIIVNSYPKVKNFCPNCGLQNHNGKFCKRCGTNLQE